MCLSLYGKQTRFNFLVFFSAGYSLFSGIGYNKSDTEIRNN